MEAKYKRVILKISGEALSSDKENIDFDIVNTLAKQVVEITELGASVGIIVGGGNIWRGRRGKGMDRITADHMGMLATVINSLALQDALKIWGRRRGCRLPLKCGRLPSHISAGGPCGIWKKGRIVILPAARGIPSSRRIRQRHSGRRKWKRI